jgi:hypothetical protein
MGYVISLPVSTFGSLQYLRVVEASLVNALGAVLDKAPN